MELVNGELGSIRIHVLANTEMTTVFIVMATPYHIHYILPAWDGDNAKNSAILCKYPLQILHGSVQGHILHKQLRG